MQVVLTSDQVEFFQNSIPIMRECFAEGSNEGFHIAEVIAETLADIIECQAGGDANGDEKQVWRD